MVVNYSLRQLRYFVATAECGGIAQASRRLNISEPAISGAIRELEISFGAQLFTRRRSAGLSLTPTGNRFLQHVQHLLRNAREFEQKILGENDIIAGEISLACFHTLAPRYVPRLVATFKKLYPDVHIQLHVVTQLELIDGMRDGKYDMAICYSHGLPQTIESVALLPDLYPQAVLPETHRFAKFKELSLSMLADDPLILLDVWPSNEYFLSLFESASVQPKIAYKVPSIELVRGLVGFELGYSILVTQPEDFRTLSGKRVLTVPVTDRLVPSRIVMAWHGATDLTNLTRKFLHNCQQEISMPPSIKGESEGLRLVHSNTDESGS
ncbi:LysR substrate-binding domain-containing protein [Rhizobium rhizogenes]|uniref:LysR substrate-binding domain-containing protein n=1 Tax=Rhizobium rhizogenes TaxID=359 RepID=UPI001572AFAD|nr:LysR substrate-binding domain-containing protein [Rhizobium rhizogenes]NTH22895.1 LysR family transcriptional regulator [Rhizobium rhizogenes]NTH35924.1 LysR family transcriptional regulator [Rhizobium rhizogenes]